VFIYKTYDMSGYEICPIRNKGVCAVETFQACYVFKKQANRQCKQYSIWFFLGLYFWKNPKNKGISKKGTSSPWEKLGLRCASCGNQASWRDPDCNKCDKPLHQKNCKGKASDCKCHEINENQWIQRKSVTAQKWHTFPIFVYPILSTGK